MNASGGGATERRKRVTTTRPEHQTAREGTMQGDRRFSLGATRKYSAHLDTYPLRSSSKCIHVQDAHAQRERDIIIDLRDDHET